MHCERYREWMLLADSGELPAGRRKRLGAHLAGCAPCRASEEQTRQLTRAAARALGSDEPGAAVLVRLRSEAEAGRPARNGPFPAAAWAAACAAVLTAAAGLWFAVPSRPASDGLGDLAAIVTALTEQETDSGVDETGGSREDRLRTMANRLLVLQGMQDEEILDESDESTAEAPQPTALQPRSSSGLAAKRCG